MPPTLLTLRHSPGPNSYAVTNVAVVTDYRDDALDLQQVCMIDQKKVDELLNMPLGPGETIAGRVELVMMLKECGYLDEPKPSFLRRISKWFKNLTRESPNSKSE